MSLSNPIYDDITYLKGVGPKRAKQLKAYGIYKILDVLYHLPRKYLDRRNIKPINQIKIGEQAVIIGKIITNTMLKISKNYHQFSEIGDINYFTLDECIKKIRPYNIEKIKVLKNVHKIIVNNKLYNKCSNYKISCKDNQ